MDLILLPSPACFYNSNILHTLQCSIVPHCFPFWFGVSVWGQEALCSSLSSGVISVLSFLYRQLVLTQHWENTLNARNHESFRFTVCACVCYFLIILTVQMLFSIASLLQIFHWIRRYVNPMGRLLVSCAAVSPCQASVVLLNLWASYGGSQIPKRGVTVPCPGRGLCRCAVRAASSKPPFHS